MALRYRMSVTVDKLYQFLDDHHLIGSVVRTRHGNIQTEQFRPLKKMQISIPTTTVHTNNNSNKISKFTSVMVATLATSTPLAGPRPVSDRRAERYKILILCTYCRSKIRVRTNV